MRLVGWPEYVSFKPLSNISMGGLRLVEEAVIRGTCHFEPLGDIERAEMTKHPKRKRKDFLDCRGHQTRPAKPRKHGKKGKYIITPAFIGEEEL